MTEDIIRIAEVKAWSKKGGAYVACPANLVGKKVLIIPKDKLGEIKILVSLATTDYVKATKEGKAK